MKYTTRALFVLIAVVALASLIFASIQTKAPKLPDCIGIALTDDQVHLLLRRYSAETLIEKSKSSTFANANNSIRIEIFSNHVVRVELPIPIDQNLRIEIPPNSKKESESKTYLTSTKLLGGTNTMIAEPKPGLLRQIFGNVSYTVTSPSKTNQ